MPKVNEKCPAVCEVLKWSRLSGTVFQPHSKSILRKNTARLLNRKILTDTGIVCTEESTVNWTEGRRTKERELSEELVTNYFVAMETRFAHSFQYGA